MSPWEAGTAPWGAASTSWHPGRNRALRTEARHGARGIDWFDGFIDLKGSALPADPQKMKNEMQKTHQIAHKS